MKTNLFEFNSATALCLKQRMKSTVFTLFLMFSWMSSQGLNAQTITSASSGNWSSASTWVGGNVPTSANDVVIADGHNVTVDGTYTCKSLTIAAGGSSHSLNIGSNSLTVTNTTTINRPTTNSRNKFIEIGTGIFFSGSLTLNNNTTTSNTRDAFLLISGSGNATITGDITLGSTGLRTYILFSGDGTLNVGGAITGGGITSTSGGSTTVGANTGTVNYNNSGNQNVGAYIYYDLITSGSGIKTLVNTTTVNNNLTISANTTLEVNTRTFTVSGSTDISGAFNDNHNTGVNTFVGQVTVNSTGTWNSATTTTTNRLIFRGGITNNNTTSAFAAGGATFNTNSQIIDGDGAYTFGGAVSITGSISVTNNSAHTDGVTFNNTVVGTVAGSTFINGTNSTMNYQPSGSANAPMATGTLNASANGNTVNYSRSGAQTVKLATYHNINFAGNNTKTLAGHITVNNNLTIESGVTLAASTRDINLGGDWINNGTFTQGTRTVTFNGAGPQGIQGSTATTFHNLVVNKSAGVLTLSNSPSVNSVLTLTNGVVTTDGNTLIVSATAVASVSRTNGWVNGDLRRNLTGTTNTYLFPVGTATSYMPATIAFSALSGAGANLTAGVTSGQHPNIGTSPISTTEYVNKYWSLTPGSITSATYSATFQFNTADVAAGTPSAFDIGKFTASTWSLISPTNSGSGPFTSQTTSQTSFGDFVIGKNDCAPTTQSSSFTSNNTTFNSANIAFTRGNGNGGVLVLAKAGSAPIGQPQFGVSYTANSSYGTSGTELGDGFVVYNGSANGSGNATGNIALSNLDEATTYHFAVYEYNITSGNPCYALSAPLQGSLLTDCITAVNVAGLTAGILNQSTNVSWINSECYDEVMVVIKASSSITASPSGDGSAYTGSLTFGSGTAFDGGFVAYKGSTSPQTIIGLSNGTTYYVKVFTRRGTNWSSGVEVTVTPSNLVNHETAQTGCSAAGNSFNIIQTVSGGQRFYHSYSNADFGGNLPSSLEFSQLAFHICTAANPSQFTFQNFTVKVKEFAANAFCIGTAGTTTVFSGDFTIDGTGWQTITLDNDFTWSNTTDNYLYVEICFSTPSPAGITAPEIGWFSGTSTCRERTSGALTTCGSAMSGGGTTLKSSLRLVEFLPDLNCTTPLNVTNLVGDDGNAQATINWTNSACYDEVMVVVKHNASITLAPTGDGSAYDANLQFGNGTAFDGGFVVYKGDASPQTITGLTNDSTYHVKVFTRKGTLWSDGVEITVTPILTFFAGTTTGNLSLWPSANPFFNSAGTWEDFRLQSFYTQADFGNPGTFEISRISWYINSATGTLGNYQNFNISLKNETGGPDIPFKTGTTHVLSNASVTINASTPQGAWLEFVLDSPFTWNQNSTLLIETCYDNPDGAPVGNNNISIAGFSATSGYARSAGGTNALGCSQTATDGVGFSHLPSLKLSGALVGNPLPIELISFNATCDNLNRTVLQWTTASETNNDYFTIQRSRDGYNWEEIGFLPGAGNSIHSLQYSFTDDQIQTSTTYYKLKQTDYDGQFSYSNIVSSNCDDYTTWEIEVVNPVQNNQIEVLIKSPEFIDAQFTLIDNLGREIMNSEASISAGNTWVTLPINMVRAGIYILRVTNGTSIKSQKIIFTGM